MVVDDGGEGADKERLWDHVLATYQADCLNESIAAGLRLKDLEAEQPQMRTYGYLILNYWKLDRIAEGRSIYLDIRRELGGVRSKSIGRTKKVREFGCRGAAD